MSDLARAVGVLLCLCLMVFPGAALAAEQIQDGSFEAGFPGWSFEKGAERCEGNTSCGPVPAASGNFYAASKTLTSLGPMAGEQPVGTITQLVPVPELPAILSFAVREIRATGFLPLLLKVKYDGQVIGEVEVAKEAFETVKFPIPGALAGPTARPLTFEIVCSNFTTMTESCARYDIDDVSLVSGTASAPIPQPAPPLDVTPPETALSQMKRLVKVKSAGARAKVKARFTSEAGARFQCKLDRRPYAACASPKTLRLKVGRHVFRVRAVDSAGNADPTPARATIRVKLAGG